MSDSPLLFGAVLRRHKKRWPWAAVACAGAIAAGALAARRTDQFRVMTPGGFQVLKRGMAAERVREVMGAGPIARSIDPDGAECLIYGHPTLSRERFTVYEACYEGGRLLRVHEKDFAAQPIDPP
jgi:hypothetical protein